MLQRQEATVESELRPTWPLCSMFSACRLNIEGSVGALFCWDNAKQLNLLNTEVRMELLSIFHLSSYVRDSHSNFKHILCY